MQNLIAFTAGRKGTGKSHWLRGFVASRPRVIHIDVTGELLRDQHVVITRDVPELLRTLRELAAAGLDTWRVALPAPDDPEALVPLWRLLAPPDDYGRGALGRAWGRIAIETGEADAIAPNGRTPAVAQGMWRRGRHYHLDLLCATQRPAACDRLLSAEADIIAVFALEEPRDAMWLRARLGRAAEDAMYELPTYWHLEARAGEPTVRLVDPLGRTVRTLPRR